MFEIIQIHEPDKFFNRKSVLDYVAGGNRSSDFSTQRLRDSELFALASMEGKAIGAGAQWTRSRVLACPRAHART